MLYLVTGAPNLIGYLESNGVGGLGLLVEVIMAREASGSQRRARPWLVLMGPTLPTLPYTQEKPAAWPRTAVWGLAAVGSLPRTVEALRLTPPLLPRVKFLLMDARGSPQAQTRWSDPITLHQGNTG